MNKLAKVAVVAAFSIAAMGAQAGVVIDDFSVGQSLIQDMTTGDGGVWATQTAFNASILGGYRDLYIQKNGSASSDGNAGVRAYVGGGALNYSQDTGQSAFGLVRWDGSATGAGIDVGGLNGVDLSTGVAIRVTVLSSDLGFPLTFTAWTDGNNDSIYTSSSVTKLAGPGPGVFDFTFAEFFGASFGKVGALELQLNNGAINDLDIQVDIVQTVPEPMSLALVGLALAGAGLAIRRRRNA